MFFVRISLKSPGKAMDYGLGGRGSITERETIFLFSAASRLVLGPIQPPVQCVPGGYFPGGKVAGE
jgi:hypothetical protein